MKCSVDIRHNKRIMSLFYKKSVILKIKKTSYFKWQGQINYSKCTIYYLLNIHFFFSPFLFLSKRFRIFSGQWKPVKEIVKGTELGVVIKDLEPLTKYEVKVAATTIAGAGNYETRSATTIEKPGWCTYFVYSWPSLIWITTIRIFP